MSQIIKELKVGDIVDWKGPFGDFTYVPNQFHELVMLACGTGIAPMIQIIDTVLSNEEDNTRLTLLYGIKTQHDILLKDSLNDYSGYWNFQVTYYLSQSSKDSIDEEKGLIHYGDCLHFGKIEFSILESFLSSPDKKSNSIKVLICGTKSFEKDMIKYLLRLGFKQENVHKF